MSSAKWNCSMRLGARRRITRGLKRAWPKSMSTPTINRIAIRNKDSAEVAALENAQS